MASHFTPLQVDLNNGDRMSRDEFLWRWEQIPELKFAELIDGVVYLSSPLSTLHSSYDVFMTRWLMRYEERFDGLSILTSATWLLGDSSPQPDVVLIRESGGTSQDAGKYRQGPPELAIEVSSSSRSYDLGPKLDLYRRNGVQEYVTVLVEEQKVQWRVLNEGHYQLLEPVDGFLKSRIFPGLWLDPHALFPPDRKRLLAGVDAGLASRGRASE